MARRLALLLALLAGPAAAETRVVGWSHLVVNDSIGEFRDRWQTSYLQGSVFLGPRSGGDRFTFGELVEVRLSSQIVTPQSLTAPDPGDRPFAGVLGFELLTHGNIGALEATVGAGVAVTGPQTGTFRFQRWLHQRIGYPLPKPGGFEVGNGVHPVFVAELGRTFGDDVAVRPFAEVRVGLEDLARIGVDLSWGAPGPVLSVRDPVTGHRAPGVVGAGGEGWRFFAGIDAAIVPSSELLGEGFGRSPLPRGRARAGAEWRTRHWSAYYGLTYLTPEFEGQPEGQFLGAFQLRLNF